MPPRFLLGFVIFGVGALLQTHLALAQNPSLAPDDLQFTKSIFPKSRVIADVELRTSGTESVRYRYEWTPDLEKITKMGKPDRTFARAAGKSWTTVGASGKPGEPVDATTGQKLDFYASAARSPFATPETHNPAQGGEVWKFIEHTPGTGCESFTYERTREHPKPDGIYPRFTFIKYPSDRDGALMLAANTAQLIGDDGRKIPISIQFRYERGVLGDEPAPIWITGDVFSKNDILYFRVDRPVKDNPQGNVVLLGSIRQAMKVFLPIFLRAADKHEKLRLYGILERAGAIPGHPEPLPNVQFIASKIHTPDDPDELPADQKIVVKSGDSVPGFEVKVEEKER